MEVFLRAKIMSMALDLASAVTTRLQPTGSPSDPPRTSRVRIESLRLRLPVSQRGSRKEMGSLLGVAPFERLVGRNGVGYRL